MMKVASVKVTSPMAKKISITWKKDSLASGYQIQYAKNAKFINSEKPITIKKNTTTKKKISKLSKNKKYYVRICAYKTVGGKKYYGPWSKTCKVKCKG